MKPTSLYHSILSFPQRSGIAVQFYEKSRLQSWTWPEYFDHIKTLAGSLHRLGVQPQTKVAIKAATGVKWGLLDLALQSLGAVTVPIYPNSTPEEMALILQDSQSRFLFLQNETQELTLQLKPPLEKVIYLEGKIQSTKAHLSWNSFIELCDEDPMPDDWFENLTPPKPEALATLIYTSGTTGRPKGVELSSIQIYSEVTEAFGWAVTPEDVSLCFLPLAHVLGRVEFWAHAYWGYTLAYAESLETLRKNLKQVRPTVFVGVPRVFEKFHEAILAQMEGLGVRRRVFEWALEIGRKISDYTTSRRKVPLNLALQGELADQLVFSKVKQAFGGRLRFAISGGAPLNREIMRFFHSCGVLILEGYGLTETTAAITVNRNTHYKFGTVGLPVGDVKIKIAPDGEILIKSQKVMMGYHNLPEETAKVLQDGWLATGDIGELLPTGELRITDRKKDLIKTSGGKYVAPQKLESLLKENPLVAQALVYGDQKKYVTVLLQINTELSQSLSSQDLEEKIRNHIAETNAKLSSYETIKKFAMVTDPWTIENGLITPSLKLKRKLLIEKYRDVLEGLY
ncbi:MAG: AMP-dependent synthetase/ligase [Bdellovibrionales bacterium]